MSHHIVARDWGWHYATRLSPAVCNVSFTIEPGERVLLTGASGSGKSTLCLALAGLLGPDQGEVSGSLLIDGQDARTQVGRIGYVMQDAENQIVGHRISDDVAFGCESWGIHPAEIASRVDWALDLVGLAHLPQDSSTTHMSGGQQQRLTIAGVLAMKPEIIVLDEPTANLDAQGAREVVAAVQAWVAKTNATLIVVDHHTGLWANVVQREIVLPEACVAPSELPPPASAHDANDTVFGDVVLQAQNLRIGRHRTMPLSLSFSDVVRAGEVVALTGPNGVGKSTLALTLAGLLKPVSGTLSVRSAPGMVFQNPAHQFLTNTVRDELLHSARAAKIPRASRDAVVEAMLARLGLSDLARAHPLSLSGGQQRRLSVATMLIDSPKILILDEPSYGQDESNWLQLAGLLAGLAAQGVALIIATHDERLLTELRARRIELAA